MFKQCCGCNKTKKSKDVVENDKEKEETDNVTKPLVDNESIKDKSKDNPELETKLETQPLIETKDNISDTAEQKDNVSVTNKKPALTIDTNPELDVIVDDYDDDTTVVPITPRTAKGFTPHPTKRNSTPGLSAIPKWLSQEDDEEAGGTAEPPVTPVGRDELALRRHRFFSDLLDAAQAATEHTHRVRFDPLGPSVAGYT